MKQAAALLSLVVAVALANPAAADDYPQHTVTFICPFPAGGGTDILTRMLAAELQEKLKQPFIVENRTGAGTQIAASAVAKSPPDGHMLLLAPVTTLAIGPSVYKSLPYDTVKDFAPVGLVGAAEFALVANHLIMSWRWRRRRVVVDCSRPGALFHFSDRWGTPPPKLLRRSPPMVLRKFCRNPSVIRFVANGAPAIDQRRERLVAFHPPKKLY